MSSSPLRRFRPAWASYWAYGLAMLALLGLWSIQRELFGALAGALGLPDGLAVVGLMVAFFPLVAGVLLHRYTRRYDIEGGATLRRTDGLLSRRSRGVELTGQVQVDLLQSVPGRLLRYGTVAFWTGDDRSRLVWENVSDPTGVLALVQELRQPGEAVAAGAGAPVATTPTLAGAARTGTTGFGPHAATTGPEESEAVDTPFGTYRAHGDGTVTHEPSGLRMIRAPWGMLWDGERFRGEPIRLGWRQAVDLFGQGPDVSYDVGGSVSALFSREKRDASHPRHGYRGGRCRVRFAGFSDWRLPTGEELGRMSACTACFSSDGTGSGTVPGVPPDALRGWGWRDPANAGAFERLYPELSAGLVHLWSATGLGGIYAWAFDGSFPVADHETRSEMAVVFVRQDTPG